MKKISVLLLCFFAFTGLNAQSHDGHDHNADKTLPVSGDALELKQAEHDFGKIPHNKPVYYYFEVVNRGSVPLKLDNVSASCGCTTPEWSKDPIPAGATQKIKVGYNAAAEGYFEKYITITYNGTGSKQVKIKGNVWRAPVGSAPSNQSIVFLKQQIQ
jgi:hypothetical protein